MLETLSPEDQGIMRAFIIAGLQDSLADMVDALGPERVDTKGLSLLQASEARLVFKVFYPKAAAWLKANPEGKSKSGVENFTFQTEFSDFLEMHRMLDAIYKVCLFLVLCCSWYAAEPCSKEVQHQMEVKIAEYNTSRKVLNGNKRVDAQYLVRFAVFFRKNVHL